jgi:hypothetical protein
MTNYLAKSYDDALRENERLRGLLADANAKMMILHNESISLHARLAEATGIINQRALELADTQGQLTEAKRDAARYRWLRDRAWPFEFNGNTPEDADAAIDKSMHLATAAKKNTLPNARIGTG